MITKLFYGIILLWLFGGSQVYSQPQHNNDESAEDYPNKVRVPRFADNCNFQMILNAMAEHFRDLKEDIRVLRNELNGKYGLLERRISTLSMEIKTKNGENGVLGEVQNGITEGGEAIDSALEGFEENAAASCKDIFNNGNNTSGVYRIQPNKGDNISIEVHCDMDEEEGGGWTVIQLRGTPSSNANLSNTVKGKSSNRTWDEFKRGFGSAHGDYWIGLRNVDSLTSGCENELKTTLTRRDGTVLHANYSNFKISGVDDYQLTISNFEPGSMAYGLLHLNRLEFRTFATELDGWVENYCALTDGGVWWHGDGCTWVDIHLDDEGVSTMKVREIDPNNADSTFIKSEMKIRSKC